MSEPKGPEGEARLAARLIDAIRETFDADADRCDDRSARYAFRSCAATMRQLSIGQIASEIARRYEALGAAPRESEPEEGSDV